MGHSTGIDIVDVKRIARLMRREDFLKRVFTEAELSACLSTRFPERGLSKIFAAKEAFFKAMNTGRAMRWKDMEVGIFKGRNTILYKKTAVGKAFNKKIHLSVAGTDSFAIALVVAENENPVAKKPGLPTACFSVQSEKAGKGRGKR